MTETVMVEPKFFSPYLKDLGVEFWAHVLDLPTDKIEELLNSGGIITPKQFDAILSVTKYCDQIKLHRIKNQVLQENDLSHLRNSFLDGIHVGNIFREQATGLKPDYKIFEDPVLNAFSAICTASYPGLLLPQKGPRLLYDFPKNFNSAHEINFTEALIADEILSSIFPDISNKMNNSQYFYTSTGTGGTIQICTFSDLLFRNSYNLMRLENKLSLDELLSSADRVLNMMRDAIIGKKVQTPILLCFRGACVSKNIILEEFDGMISPFHEGFRDVFPSNTQPEKFDENQNAGFVYQSLLEYKLSIFETDPYSEGFFEPWPVKIFDENFIESIVNDISFASVMCAETKHHVSVHRISTMLFDPFAIGGKVSWRVLPYNITKPLILDDSESEILAKWIGKISNQNDDKIRMSKRRLLSALTDRINSEDSFIDAMIGLENLFATRSEVGLSIAMCVSKIMSNDQVEREEIFKEIKKLYNLRSSIVHGSENSIGIEDMNISRNKTLNYLIGCLKNLYENHGDLLEMKTSERVKTIAIQ